MRQSRSSERTIQSRSWAWFGVWAVLELTVAVGAFTLGLLWPDTLVLIVLVVVGCRIAQRRSARASMVGLLSGTGAVFLYIAWIERGGPGGGQMNPYPWLLVGISLVIAGVFAQAHRR